MDHSVKLYSSIKCTLFTAWITIRQNYTDYYCQPWSNNFLTLYPRSHWVWARVHFAFGEYYCRSGEKCSVHVRCQTSWWPQGKFSSPSNIHSTCYELVTYWNGWSLSLFEKPYFYPDLHTAVIRMGVNNKWVVLWLQFSFYIISEQGTVHRFESNNFPAQI